jgi:CBS domain-containing protein
MTPVPIDTDASPTVVIELIHRLHIKDAMTSTIVTGKRNDTLRSLQHLMREHRISGVPVAEGTRLLGIVSLDDIIRALDEGYIDEPTEAHMTRQVIVLEDDMPLSLGISYMNKYSYGRFPVINRNKELVGILTSRDIIARLLVELNREAERNESDEPVESTGDTVRRDYRVRRFDFENAGTATGAIKVTLKKRGLPTDLIRRIAVATYELEINQVVHSNGGTISAAITPEFVEIVADDVGPGIEDVELALEEGYSTATEWIRSLGFGAGLGLPNVRRVSDQFTITSAPDGTTVRARIETKGKAHEDS